MKNSFDSAVTLASEQILAKTYELCEKETDLLSYVELGSAQIEDLGDKILALHDDDIAMLFLYYVFGMDYSDIAAVLKQDMIKGKLIYIERILSIGMELIGTMRIGQASLRLACGTAMLKYTQEEDAGLFPNYSISFIRAMRKIKAARGSDRPIYKLMRKAAIFVVVTGVSFGIALGVNAELREKVYQWFVKTFPQFSEFSLSTDAPEIENSFEELARYRPAFIPDGYTEQSVTDLYPSIYYDYVNESGLKLTIIGRLPDEDDLLIDTEGAEIEIVKFLGEDAYYWEKGGNSYFTFILDGYHFSIVGQISRDETVKIAENIKIK